MASRDIMDCVPELQAVYLDFQAKMREVKIPFIITCTARTFKEQVALYAQGRQDLLEVNALRRIAGMMPIMFKENLYCVTWTLKSRHIINLDDDDIGNDKARAFDISILRNGKATWDLKVSVNENEKPDYLEAAEIGAGVGLVPGAFWHHPDYSHYQLAGV